MRAMRLLAAVVMCGALAGVSALPVAAHDQDGNNEPDYLALGDSVAFGFNPRLDFHNAGNFIGYPEALARRVDLDLTNAACPGETSDGFISHANPELDHGCIAYRANFPLHVAYTGSQLDFTVHYLLSHPDTRLVTIDLGANDLFLLQEHCIGDAACIASGLPALTQHLAANLSAIYSRIRGDAHYAGLLVALTYYTVDYRDKNAVQAIKAVNATVAATTLAAHGRVADGFDAFRFIAAFAGGNSCKAGLLIVLNRSPLTCDIHPSPLGREVLATAVQPLLWPR